MFVALSVVFAAQTARAQTTIFNIPSTDVVDKSKGYFEFDFLPQAPGPANGASTIIYNPRFLVGIGHDVEVGVNFPIFHNGDANPSNFDYIQPNLKYKFYKNDDMGLAASAGFVINTPLNQRSGQATWTYFYGNFSKKWGKDGPRATFGAYGVAANNDPTSGPVSFIGTRGGVILGYEQPLGGPVSFVADWFSQKNNLGYFTPGISVTLPHSGLFNIGYSIGNDVGDETANYKNRYVFAYYGITFP